MATFGRDVESDTICGDFGYTQRYNLIYGSDNPDSAGYEIDLFLKPDEIVDYELTNAHWIGVND